MRRLILTPEGRDLASRVLDDLAPLLMPAVVIFLIVLAGLLYFTINYAIERFGRYVERKTAVPS